MDEQIKLSKDEQLFLTLVTNFQTSAWIRMGKIKDPITDTINRNLDECKFAIDMIEMLSRRMAAEMTETEKQYVNNALTELRMNFIEESNKPEVKPTAPSTNETNPPNSSPPSSNPSLENEMKDDGDTKDSTEPKSGE